MSNPNLDPVIERDFHAHRPTFRPDRRNGIRLTEAFLGGALFGALAVLTILAVAP